MNAGDTAWLLTSCALVLLMTPGLAFFYGGLVPERAVLNTMKMSFIALGLIAIEWSLIGYSMAFAPGSSLLGGFAWAALSGVGTEPSTVYSQTTPHLAFMAFQMMFAIITPALISGAIVGRMRFKAYAAFIVLWGVIVYNPLAHWVWGSGGWIGELGALDFAGGTVVHGLLYGNPQLLVAQIISVVASAVFAAAGTAVILYALRTVMALRPSPEDEVLGIDVSEHGEAGYVLDRGAPLAGPRPT